MENTEVKIELYDKREKSTATIYVEKLSENKFKMTDNDIWNCRLTLGTEFETRINEEGKHEIVRITRESDFITRRFCLSSKYKESDYRMLGDELVKRGGFWQVDFGGIATVNIPKNFEYDLDQIMIDLDLSLTEIVDEEKNIASPNKTYTQCTTGHCAQPKRYPEEELTIRDALRLAGQVSQTNVVDGHSIAT